jgi:four helix bundle suffix protein
LFPRVGSVTLVAARVRAFKRALSHGAATGADRSHWGGRSLASTILPPHGGYRRLLAYQQAEVVFDATAFFCSRYIDRRSRTRDQMVQAARSGKQNIAEGSMASGTSKEMEIKLTNVARASLEELLIDYQDFLRLRGAPLWDKNSLEARYVRAMTTHRREGDAWSHRAYSSYSSYSSYSGSGPGEVNRTNRTNRTHRTHRTNDAHGQPMTYETFRPIIETRPPEVVANVLLCLIHQVNYLLDRQLRQLERAFLREGGLRERMTRARLRERGREAQRGGGR